MAKRRWLAALLAAIMTLTMLPIHCAAAQSNEEIVYQYLTNNMGLNCAAACGVLANIRYESGFSPINMQNDYEKGGAREIKPGYTDETYTKAVDSGTYKNFGSDWVGYGLVQWTHPTLKENLLAYAKSAKKSIGNMTMQLQFLEQELTTDFKSSVLDKLRKVPNSAKGAYDAGYIFCYYFERPADKESRAVTRGNYARNTYWAKYAMPGCTQYTGYLTGTVINASSLNIRSTPSVSGTKVGSYAQGGSVTVTAVWKSSDGSIWYEVSKGYVSAKYVQAAHFPKKVTITDPNSPWIVAQGDSFAIGGVISSQYVPISKVTATIKDSSGKVIMTAEDTPNASTYSLRGSRIDAALRFGTLAAGNYTYQVKAQVCSNYYNNDDGKLAVKSQTVTLLTQDFSVKTNATTTAASYTPVVSIKLVNGNTYIGKPQLSWETSMTPEKFKVYRATSKSGTYSLIYTTTGHTLTNSSASSGTTYYYKVEAIYPGNQTVVSDPVSIITACDAPVVSIGLTNSKYPTKPHLKWDAVKGAAEYRVYRATSKSGTYSLKYTTTNCSYTNTDSAGNTTYYYKVAAVNANKKLHYSGIVKITTPHDAPAISGTLSGGKPKLTWNAVNKAVKYKVYRATSKNGTYSLKYTTAGCSFINTSAAVDKTYYYKVTALFDDNAVTESNIISITAGCTAPKLSANLVSGASYTNKPNISWGAVDGAAKYEVHRADKADGTYSLLYTTSRCAFTNFSVPSGATYYYKVAAVSPNGVKTFSKPIAATAACDAPGISGKLSDGKPNLTWKSVNGAVTYKIYRATSKSGTYTRCDTVTDCAYRDAAAVASTTYYYKVAAVSAGKTLTYSNIVKVTAQCQTPVVTTTLSSGSSYKGKPKLSWDAIDDAVHYEVYRATSKSGTYALRVSTTDLYFTNSSAKSGSTYYYKVAAVSPDGTLTYSSIVSVSAACDAPELTGKLSSGKPKVTWAAVDGAVEYRVYRATSKSGTYALRVNTTDLHFTNTSAKGGTSYYYKVAAVNADGVLTYSAPIKITSACDAPLIGAQLSGGKPKITWSAVNGATEYQVYRANSENGSYARRITTTDLYYTNTSAKKGVTYYYKVAAVNIDGKLTYSTPIKVLSK